MTEPSHLCADLKALRAEFSAFKELMTERDKRYGVVDLAQKEAVKSALTAAEKSAEKTEVALKEYKVGANEWRDTVKDLVSKMPTRAELVGYAVLSVALVEFALKFLGKVP